MVAKAIGEIVRKHSVVNRRRVADFKTEPRWGCSAIDYLTVS